MPSAAASSRLHIVVLSADELAEQEAFDRATISFAVDRGTESPGHGRVAVVVTHDHQGNVAITHLGWVKAGGSRTTSTRPGS